MHATQPQILDTTNCSPVSSDEKPNALSCQESDVKNMAKHPNINATDRNNIR